MPATSDSRASLRFITANLPAGVGRRTARRVGHGRRPECPERREPPSLGVSQRQREDHRLGQLADRGGTSEFRSQCRSDGCSSPRAPGRAAHSSADRIRACSSSSSVRTSHPAPAWLAPPQRNRRSSSPGPPRPTGVRTDWCAVAARPRGLSLTDVEGAGAVRRTESAERPICATTSRYGHVCRYEESWPRPTGHACQPAVPGASRLRPEGGAVALALRRHAS